MNNQSMYADFTYNIFGWKIWWALLQGKMSVLLCNLFHYKFLAYNLLFSGRGSVSPPPAAMAWTQKHKKDTLLQR